MMQFILFFILSWWLVQFIPLFILNSPGAILFILFFILSWCNSSYSSNRPGATRKKLNKFCPPSSSHDFRLFFCLYPSSMPATLRARVTLVGIEAYIFFLYRICQHGTNAKQVHCFCSTSVTRTVTQMPNSGEYAL